MKDPLTEVVARQSSYLGAEPLHGVLLGDLVRSTDSGSASLLLGDTVAGATHHAVEVHTENTDGRIVLETEIDVLIDTETEVSGIREGLLPELVLLDLIK